MKSLIAVLPATVLLVFAFFGVERVLAAGRYGGGNHRSNAGAYAQNHGNYSSSRPVYGVSLTSGREIAGTSARAQWVWVDGPTQADLDRQKARDDAFRAAFEEYQKTFPFMLTPGE